MEKEIYGELEAMVQRDIVNEIKPIYAPENYRLTKEEVDNFWSYRLN